MDPQDAAFTAADYSYAQAVHLEQYYHYTTWAMAAALSVRYAMRHRAKRLRFRKRRSPCACAADSQFVALSINRPASVSDGSAWRSSGLPALAAALPDGYFLVGDAQYPSSNKMLVPFPGEGLPAHQDAYNYYQSSSRICVEQAFGTMVKTWGILWRPLAVPLKHQTRVLHSIGRLHNFLRRLNDDPPEAPGQPGIVNGILEDQVWKPPMTPGGGRAAAASSNTRNEIVETIARRGLRRPAHNVAEDNHP